ncbi:MAG: hypothetical protein EBU28_00710 [Gammaproteobacteria bacterium]|nr:hypothetical protein [Gammaproteobacteria bacterium]
MIINGVSRGFKNRYQNAYKRRASEITAFDDSIIGKSCRPNIFDRSIREQQVEPFLWNKVAD